jgi:RNA polymerase sigma factor (sigma-70 family)
VNTEAPKTAEHGPGRFNTTRWSVVLSCADSGIESVAARDALSELCKTYWRPIFAYICRRGYPIHDAEDLTQDFFTSLLQGPLLQRADPERGRFRSLLLKALQDFLGHATEKLRAYKRGGGMRFVSWDDWMAEAPSQLSVSAQALNSWSAEQLFDLRWAATVVEQALRRLREECQSKQRLRLFETLSLYLATDRSDVSYHNLATTLGIGEPAVKKQLHNLRRRYRWLIHEEVAQTVENPSDVEDEIRYLCATLAAGAEAAV